MTQKQSDIREKYTYPVITVENFDKLTKRLVGIKKIWSRGWNRYATYPYLKVRAPRTRDDFYNFTKNMFGEGMTLKGLEARPEIEHSRDYYDRNPIYKLWKDKVREGSRMIGHTAFGYMGTGGWDYASFDNGFKYREQKRLKSIFNSKLSIRLSEVSNQYGG